jgi:hypothetical protein
MLKRGGGNLSPLLHCAWDHGNLPALDTHQQLAATGAHTSNRHSRNPLPPRASLLFGMSTGDPVADRIREAIESAPAGYMSKNQIRGLFHGHLEASRIDAALEKLVALGALDLNSQPTTGRSSTLWSTSQEKYRMEMEELPADDEPAEDG